MILCSENSKREYQETRNISKIRKKKKEKEEEEEEKKDFIEEFQTKNGIDVPCFVEYKQTIEKMIILLKQIEELVPVLFFNEFDCNAGYQEPNLVVSQMLKVVEEVFFFFSILHSFFVNFFLNFKSFILDREFNFSIL